MSSKKNNRKLLLQKLKKSKYYEEKELATAPYLLWFVITIFVGCRPPKMDKYWNINVSG